MFPDGRRFVSGAGYGELTVWGDASVVAMASRYDLPFFEDVDPWNFAKLRIMLKGHSSYVRRAASAVLL